MKDKNSILTRFIFICLLAAYLFLLAYLTFLSPYFMRGEGLRNINPVPFKTIVQFLVRDGGTRSIMINIAGNIAAFMPLGFLLPLAFTQVKKMRSVILVSLFVTLAVESIQYLLSTGVSDIDDIILNLLGSIAGYGCYKFLFWLLRRNLIGFISKYN